MRSSRRAALGALLLGLLSLPAFVTASAPAAGAVVTAMRGDVIGAQPVLYRHTFTIRGSVRRSDGTAVPDTADGVVVLSVKYAGSDHTSKLATSSDESAWSFTVTAGRNASYRIDYTGGTAGATAYGPAYATAPVTVRRNLGDNVVTRDGHPVLVGDVDPGWASHPVEVQRRTCGGCAWATWKRVTTSSTGAWSARLAAKSTTGTWDYRAKVATTTDYATSWSNQIWSVHTG